jgi:hypothetical protein
MFRVGLTLLVLLSVSTAFAGETEDAYEEVMVNRALSSQGLRRESNPAGKKIERIYVSNNEVVSEGDVWPSWFNNFHVTTTVDVIQRELLFKAGDRWETARVDESGRNLRSFLYLATARIVAAQGSQGGVVAVVVTKDIWSLRPEMSFSFVGSSLELLEFHPAEYNLAGRNKTLGADIRLDLATYLLGIRYSDPRVFGSRLSLDQNADLIWNKSSGTLEGGLFHTSFGQPLYSLSTEWSWRVGLDYRKDIYRLFSDGQLLTLRSSVGDVVPYQFGRRVLQPSARVTRSFGLTFKHDLTLGWRGLVKHYELPVTATPLQPQTVTEFNNNILPFSEEAGIVFLTYHAYNPSFVQLVNIETYELTEDFRLGPDLVMSTGLAKPAFGYSSDFIEPSVSLSYLWLLGQDLFSLGVSGSARHQQNVLPGAVWVNELATFTISNITAPFAGGMRLHVAGRYIRRENDLDHDIETVGGDGALRGYPSRFFPGPNAWGANFELRSRPYPWHSLHFGWVAFLDSGDAFGTPAEATMHTSVGVGLRVGVPQFNRPVLRFDLATPLETISGASPAYFSAQFGQAF